MMKRQWLSGGLIGLWMMLCVQAADGTNQLGFTAADRPPCCRTNTPSGLPTDRSLYLLDSLWTSDVRKTIPLAVLRGRPQVLALFFSNCEYACPIIVHDLKSIRDTLPVSIRDSVDFLLVSLDSQRDTPDVLAEYRKRQRLEMAHWTLLTGREEDVRELAALLGVIYRKDARGQFSHSNVLFVLNQEGEIVHRQVGLNQNPTETVKVLERLVEK
jgi:protein SCO1/2